MRISDIGIILFSRKLQEKLLLVKIFSENNGICAGVIKYPSKKNMPDFQVGNLVSFQKYSRLSDQLGTITCECDKSMQAYLMHDRRKLFAFNSVSHLILSSFPESQQYGDSYRLLRSFLDLIIHKDFSWLFYCELELEILQDAGYGLDIYSCAVTGETENLIYVSPKTGRAVSEVGARGYEHLLLKLPQFLLFKQEPESAEEIEDALTLSEYFFARYIWKHKTYDDVASARSMLRSVIAF